MAIPDLAHDAQDDLVRLRRDLHRIPELGLDLPRTQERVLAALEGLPLEITSGDGLSSITAVLRGRVDGANGGASGNAKSVLLRGDMDALPVVESTGVDYVADSDNMHACGHDLHTSMLVGAAHVLSAQRDQLAGDVVFMFQPGEEGYDGARHMVSEGVLDATGRRVDSAFAIHVASAMLPGGFFAGRTGPMLSAADTLTVTVKGAGGHGSTPHRAKDPIPAACEMVTALQTFVTRRFDIWDPVVVTVGAFHAGTMYNIIPETATFQATVRSFSQAAHEQLMAEMTNVCEGIASAYGLEVDARYEQLYPVTVNHASGVDLAKDVVADHFGADHWIELPNPLPGSEDFSRVLDQVPGAIVFLGATPEGGDPFSMPFNHSNEAVFDDSVLHAGVTLYADFATRALATDQSGSRPV